MGLKILIIDDQQELVDILEDIFMELEEGVTIHKALNGLEGYEKAMNEEYHLICTDYRMPLLNGDDLVGMIRAPGQINSLSPILFITGFNPDLTPEPSQWENVFFISKPFDVEKIELYLHLSKKLSKEKGKKAA